MLYKELSAARFWGLWLIAFLLALPGVLRAFVEVFR